MQSTTVLAALPQSDPTGGDLYSSVTPFAEAPGSWSKPYNTSGQQSLWSGLGLFLTTCFLTVVVSVLAAPRCISWLVLAQCTDPV